MLSANILKNDHTPPVRAFRFRWAARYDPAMKSRRPRRCRVAPRPILLLLLFAVLVFGRPSASAPPVPQPLDPATQSTPPATTRSAPATTQAAAEMIPELRAALAHLNHTLPADVCEGRRDPGTDREKLAWNFLAILSYKTNGLNEGSFEKFQKESSEADKKIEERFASMRADHAEDGTAVRAEIDAVERLTRQVAHMHDFMNRPTKFANERESQLDLAGRIDQIPPFFDRFEKLGRDLDYHNKRLALLVEMAELRAAAEKGDDAAQAARQKLDADTALLAAKDKEYEAQLAADQIKVPTTAPATQGAAGLN